MALLRQVTQAPIGWEEISHEAWHLQTCCYGDTAAPNLQHSFTAVTEGSTAISWQHMVTAVSKLQYYNTNTQGNTSFSEQWFPATPQSVVIVSHFYFFRTKSGQTITCYSHNNVNMFELYLQIKNFPQWKWEHCSVSGILLQYSKWRRDNVVWLQYSQWRRDNVVWL